MTLRRIIAFSIDYIILILFGGLYFGITQYSSNFLEGDALECFILISWYLFPVLMLLYIALKDSLFTNQSIGKKIMKLQVLQIDERLPKKRQLASRNLILIFLFWIEVVMIFVNNGRFGDSYAKTKVVNK